MKKMIKFFDKISRLIFCWPNYIPHIRTKLLILFMKCPNITFHGRGRFNQKAIFYGKGSIRIGNNYSIGYRYGGGYHGALCEIQARTEKSIVTIGNNIATNNGVMICAADSIVIGDSCLIGQGVIIIDHDTHGINPNERRTSIGNIRPICVGNNVWIGSRAIILPGTSIGDNCVIGAGSIVKGVFPNNAIVAGNPARIVKIIQTK